MTLNSESSDVGKMSAFQLFSFQGLVLLIVVIPSSYLLLGPAHAFFISGGIAVGILFSIFGILACRRGIFQFSIRGLLLLITVVCGLAIWQQNQSVSQKDAVAKINQLGGAVQTYLGSDGRPQSLAQIVRRPIWPQQLRYLQSIPNLKRLDLDYTKIGDFGMGYVGKLTDLQFLDVEDTDITDAGLKRLSSLQALQVLILDGNDISNQGLLHLGKLKSLRSVRIRRTNVSADGIEKFQQLLPECEVQLN